MKSWLRFFGLSFFSDKVARESKSKGFLSFFLGLLLALAFIFCGLLAANFLPFATHYNHATDFKAFAQAAFDNLDVTVSDSHAAFDTVVNTFVNKEDADLYSTNGYNLVVDTRPSTALDDFETYCVYYDGSSEITYEAYLALPDEEKINYIFNLRYTPNELVLTDELVAQYEQYLNTTDSDDIKQQYNSLLASKNSISQEEYNLDVYALYLQAYYPEITKYVSAGSAPLLRNYYYDNYINSQQACDYLLIFEEFLVGSFHTDGNLPVTFYGLYSAKHVGNVSASETDAFLRESFYAAVPLYASLYLGNILRYLVVVTLFTLALAFVAWLVLRTMKSQWGRSYSTVLKVEGAYLAVAALITTLIFFVCGFFVSGSMLNDLPLMILSVILFVRTVFLLVYDKRHGKVTAKASETENNE